MQKAPTLPPDPTLQSAEQAAQNQNITALETQAQGDSASLMARYGTRLAIAGSTGTGTGTNPSSPMSPLIAAFAMPGFAAANMLTGRDAAANPAAAALSAYGGR